VVKIIHDEEEEEDEAAAAAAAVAGGGPSLYVPTMRQAGGRGLHSSSFRLNVSALCGIGAAFRGCLGGVSGVIRGIRGVQSEFLFQKRLRLSCEVDECKPLEGGITLSTERGEDYPFSIAADAGGRIYVGASAPLAGDGSAAAAAVALVDDGADLGKACVENMRL